VDIDIFLDQVQSITLGTDLVEIDRLRQAVEAHAPRLAERLFTTQEWTYCQGRSDPYASLAARFAGKEALRKIFGQWGLTAVTWKETEIATSTRGVPCVVLHGSAERQARGHRFSISLSHTRTHAQAVCVAYRDTDARRCADAL
jgi:holo-[acyl-carrier protein] synthase